MHIYNKTMDTIYPQNHQVCQGGTEGQPIREMRASRLPQGRHDGLVQTWKIKNTRDLLQ